MIIERLLEEAGVYGLLGEECPDDVDTEIGIAESLIEKFRDIGMDDVADYWQGNLVIFGEM